MCDDKLTSRLISHQSAQCPRQALASELVRSDPGDETDLSVFKVKLSLKQNMVVQDEAASLAVIAFDWSGDVLSRKQFGVYTWRKRRGMKSKCNSRLKNND